MERYNEARIKIQRREVKKRREKREDFLFKLATDRMFF